MLLSLNRNLPQTGDLSDEEKVLAWLIEQKTSDTIEELTDELLANIIRDNEYVVVYFSSVHRCMIYILFFRASFIWI